MNYHNLWRLPGAVALVAAVCLFSACATTPKTANHEVNNDPLEPVNRSFYSFNEGLDKYLMKPIATTYIDITPEPVRTGITNFFDNINYLNTMVNSFLQGKFDQGLSDMFRFIFNTTIGIGGLFDVASTMGLEEHKEDLGQTFGVWGAGEGAYLTIPLFGPNTVRDAPDLIAGSFLNPLTYISNTVFFPVTAFRLINTRANLLKATNIRDEAAIDPYSFTREAYLQQRRSLIYDGSPPTDGYDDLFFDEDPEVGTELIID